MSEPLPWEDYPEDAPEDDPEDPGYAKGADDHINEGGELTEIDPEELEAELGPTRALNPWEHPRTDLGNAEILKLRYGSRLRWCKAQKEWWVWNGRQWSEDHKSQAAQFANKVSRIRQNAADGAGDDKAVKAEYAWGLSGESLKGRDACLGQAKSLDGLALDLNELDEHHLLLNCLNGIVDLRTGQIQKHRADLFMSKIIKTTYDPKAKCPLWEAYLEKVMGGKQELIKFLQRSLGYSLTGSTQESALFVLWGDGSNGKSVLLDTATSVFGDYATTAASDALIAKNRSGGPNPEIAMLRGARFVSASETASGARLDEAMIKQMTGGDMVTARFLNANYVTFKPSAKIWLATNHKPEIRGTDWGIWRRIKLIPFAVKIPDEEQDKGLLQKLRAEWPGILAWAIRGCQEWMEGGLQEPDEVRLATKVYQSEMDPIQGFLDGCCLVGTPLVKSRCMEIYEAYRKWAEAAGERPLTLNKFGRHLTAKHIPRVRMRDAWYYEEIMLKERSTQDIIGDLI